MAAQKEKKKKYVDHPTHLEPFNPMIASRQVKGDISILGVNQPLLPSS
uniref:Uncharacterized protein n=1 Tax=Arundo donax TaxID=35708 RepID=A0A0A9GQV8_ARUDO